MYLALDTATSYLAVAYGERELLRDVGRRHAEQLAEAVCELGALKPSAIVIGTGPGSYTGLRVGASYALGLGRALGVPVLGVSTLAALIDPTAGTQAVSLAARAGSVYGAIYQVEGGGAQRELLAPGKFTRDDFARLASGLPWRAEVAPSALALARAGVKQREWKLSYL